MLNTEFKDKAALVTGAAGSLGRAVAARLPAQLDLTDGYFVQSMGSPG